MKIYRWQLKWAFGTAIFAALVIALTTGCGGGGGNTTTVARSPWAGQYQGQLSTYPGRVAVTTMDLSIGNDGAITGTATFAVGGDGSIPLTGRIQESGALAMQYGKAYITVTALKRVSPTRGGGAILFATGPALDQGDLDNPLTLELWTPLAN